MDIKSSLVIEQQQPRSINLIVSGSFVAIYNQSLYLLTERLGKCLKLKAGYIKSANNRFVVSGGFPTRCVERDYPQAVKTAWGYQITGDFNVSGYSEWLFRHKTAAKAVDNVEAAVVTSSAHSALGVTTENFPQLTGQNRLLLSEQQMLYLLGWQKGLYPLEVDLGFIESLKANLNFLNFNK